jgi:hypothetical protein
MTIVENTVLGVVKAEMLAEGIVTIEDGVPLFEINGRSYMLEMRAFDITEEP